MTRESTKVKLIDFSGVINLHHLPCNTEKCHTDDVVYFEGLGPFGLKAQFGIGCKLCIKILKHFLNNVCLKFLSPSRGSMDVCFSSVFIGNKELSQSETDLRN